MQEPNDTSSSRTLRNGVLMAALGEALLTLMDTLIKSVSGRYPTFEIAFLRFAFGGLFACGLYGVLRPGWPTREAFVANTARAGLVVVTATSFFFALGRLPLADAVALSFISPMFMALFGVLLLGEAVDRRIAAALGAGFAGMLLIVADEAGRGTYTDDALLGAGACLVSAIAYALAIVLLRARAQRDPIPVILLFQNVGPALILAIPAGLVWVTPTPRDLALFAGIGGLGIVGHAAMARAFSRVEASRLAPVHYTTLAWALVLGYLAFGHIPGLTTFLGAALIVIATVLTQRRT